MLQSRCIIDISPNQNKFKQGIDQLVAGFSNTIGKFLSFGD